MQMQMLNNAKAKGFWFKAFRGKRFIILKKEKKKLEKFKGLFRFRLLWQNSDMTAAAKALAAVKKGQQYNKMPYIKKALLHFFFEQPERQKTYFSALTALCMMKQKKLQKMHFNCPHFSKILSLRS